MKKVILILFFISFQTLFVWGEERVPGKIRFANMELELDKDARALVEEKINLLNENRTLLREFHERAALYFPLIEQVLRTENVPSDFKYLALQESMLLANATSRSDGVGYWQLKDFNAKELGIRVDVQVDARKHPMSSTKAAAKYLKKNHYFMQNWLYTLLSYRLGVTGTNNMIDRKYIGANAMKLDGKMHAYIANYLAYKLTFNRLVAQPNLRLFEFAQASGKSLDDVAKLTTVDLTLLQQYNAWLKVNVVPSNLQYPLLLPIIKNKEADLVKKFNLTAPSPSNELITDPKELAAILENAKQKKRSNGEGNAKQIESEITQETPSDKYPILKKRRTQEIAGEEVTLVTANGIPAFIAGRFRNSYNVLEGLKISDSKFRKYNEMSKFETLIPGQVYYLKKKEKKGPIAQHIARRGETLWEISQKFGVRLKSLYKLNRMEEGEDLVAGRVLFMQERRSKNSKPTFKPIPKTPTENKKPTVANSTPKNNNSGSQAEKNNNAPSDKTTANPNVSNAVVNNRFHIVKEGENVFSISRDYGITPIQIKQWNDLPEDLTLTTGQILIVRDEDKATTGTSSTVPEDAPFDPLANVVLLDDDGNPINQNGNKANASKNGNKNNSSTLPGDPKESNVKEITHVVKRGESLYRIARNYEVEEDQIVAWNNLKNKFVRPGQKLTIIQVESRKIDLNEIPSSNNTNNTTRINTPSTKSATQNLEETAQSAIHTVVKGETLYAIAKKYNLEVNDLMVWNNIGSNTNIIVGQVLNVQNPATFAANDQPSEPARQIVSKITVPEGYHLVEKGETLYDVAFRYNLTQTEIREWNNMSSTDQIAEGQQIIVNRILARSISKAKERPSTAPKTKYHTVAKGETLYGISLKYGVKIPQLQAWNNLNGSSISPGDRLVIGYTPGIQSGSQQAAVSSPTLTKASPTVVSPMYHTVKKGETLYSIARRYKVEQNTILQLSGKQSSQLKIGERLRIK